jgi:long-chain acyl-CoA synthetase
MTDTSICELFARTAAIAPEAVAVRTPDRSVELTWAEYRARAHDVAAGLAALGVRRGDVVALMLTNRPEFHFCDAGAMLLGATAFSIYNTLGADTVQHVLGNAGARVVICERQFLPVLEQARASTAVEHLVCVDGAGAGTLSLDALLDGGDPAFDVAGAAAAVGPDDVLTLIYTSGTTGPPKGVELTHANMLAELRATAELLPVEHGDPVPSAFPMAHAAERWGSHYRGMAHGYEIVCVDDLRTLPQILNELRPPVWGSVPRVWEKLYAGLQAAFAAEPDEAKRQAVAWAIDTGLRRVRAEQAALDGRGDGPAAELLAEAAKADALVLRALRQRLGLDDLRWAIVGAAPTSLHILEFFAAIGIPLCELWGMSELSTIATLNPPGRAKLGTVGLPLPGVELRLAGDGEILVRGAIVMRGYRGEPEKTAEAIDADGWLHTGDVGTLDAQGYLRIVDRKKELIINAAGKNMSPANIEAAIKGADPLIAQAVAIGDGRAYNVALLTLDPEVCAAIADGAAPADVAASAAIRERLEQAVARANEGLARVEQIKRFEILPDVWEPGGEELTPTMKLKRKPIAARYETAITGLYA